MSSEKQAQRFHTLSFWFCADMLWLYMTEKKHIKHLYFLFFLLVSYTDAQCGVWMSALNLLPHQLLMCRILAWTRICQPLLHLAKLTRISRDMAPPWFTDSQPTTHPSRSHSELLSQPTPYLLSSLHLTSLLCVLCISLNYKLSALHFPAPAFLASNFIQLLFYYAHGLVSLLVFLLQSYSVWSTHPPLSVLFVWACSLLSRIYSTNANLFRVVPCSTSRGGSRRTPSDRAEERPRCLRRTWANCSSPLSRLHAWTRCLLQVRAHNVCTLPASVINPRNTPSPLLPSPNPISRLCFPHWSSGSVLQLSLPLSWNYINLKFIDSISNSTAPLPAVSRCSSPPSATFRSCCLLRFPLIQCFAAAVFFLLPPPLVSMCTAAHIWMCMYIYTHVSVCVFVWRFSNRAN